jgi:O-antigen ligase
MTTTQRPSALRSATTDFLASPQQLGLAATKPFDGVSVLTYWIALAFLIPASQVVEQVGAAGKPSVLFGYGLLLMWVATRFLPSAVLPGFSLSRWLVGIYFIVFVCAYAFGVLRGLSPVEVNGTDRSLIVQVSMVSAAIVAIDGIPSRKRFDDLMLRVIGLSAAISVVGAIQFFWAYDLAEFMTLPGLGLNGQEAIVTIDARSGFNRVSATTGHAIEYGAVMAMMLPISLHYFLHDKHGLRRNLLAVATGLIALGIPLSLSRTSTIAVAIVSLGLAITWSGKTLIRAVVISLIGGAVLRASVPNLLGSIIGLFTGLGEDSSFTARTSDYPIVFRFIRERPFFGRGPGTFGPTGYILLDNEILSSTVNTGLIGLAGFLGMYIGSLFILRRVVWTSPFDETRHLAVTLWLSMLIATIVLYFADMKFFTVYSSLTFLFFGMTGALWRLRSDRSRFDVEPRNFLKPKLRADRARRDRPIPFERIVNRGGRS